MCGSEWTSFFLNTRSGICVLEVKFIVAILVLKIMFTKEKNQLNTNKRALT